MANVYIISSSPPTRHLSIFDMPSSPPLPSVDDVLKKKPKVLRTGSHASPIPQFANATFTSPATLLQRASSRDVDVDTAEDFTRSVKPKARKASVKRIADGEKLAKPRKVATKDEILDGETAVKKARKPRTKKVEIVEDGEIVPKLTVKRKSRANKTAKDTLTDGSIVEKPPRKTKAKKDSESQLKLPKGKVTKVSTLFNAKELRPTVLKDNLDYGLVGAISRRKTWTPPPQSRQDSATTTVDVGLFDGSLSVGSLLSGEKLNGFTDLLGNYGFTKADSQTTKTTVTAVGVRKRKLIELVKTSVATAAAKTPEKAPKKKARTLTDLATSAYAEEEEAAPADPAPLLQYFSLQTAERTTADGFKIPSKPRSRSPTKGRAKAKKGSLQAPILLSPESAIKQVGRQDFVFGTSSQLAREDSPTLLRDLHEAMQASNEAEAEDDPFADILTESVSQSMSDRGKSSVSAKRNLWSAASRGAEATLEDVETVDLANTPVPAKTAAVQAILELPSSMHDEEDESFWHDVEELSQSLTQKTQPVEVSSQISVSEDPIAKLSPTPTKIIALEADLPEYTLPASTQPPEGSQLASKPARKPRKLKELVMPDFSSYTTAQLTKEIASYKFKPIKSRNSMVTLLEKCWEGKHKAALAAQSTNKSLVSPAKNSKPPAPAQNPPEASPKRPRGRPRKDGTPSPAKPSTQLPRKKGLTSVEYLEMDSDTPLSQMRTPKRSPKKPRESAEDIFGSEAILTPSPPRRKSSPKKTKALTLKISSSLSDASLELSPTSSQRLLFKYISTAVTNATRAKDSINPSWHEKILLYDPIILEDLTIWLNTGALEKAGWDGEVDPKEVKKWCESKSICCLWRENLRGGTRSRY